MVTKISRATFINILLLITLVMVIGFGYFYYLKKDPVELAANVVVPPEQLSYQYLYSISGKGKYVLDKPEGLTYGDNKIWVADSGNSRVVVFDLNGEPLFEFGNKEGDEIKLKGPVGVLVDNNRVFVVDIKLRNIVEYKTNGDLVGYFGEKNVPMPAVLKKYNDMYAALDMAGPGLIFLDQTGEIVQRTYLGVGQEEGKANFPQDFAVMDDRIYLADSNNNRLQYADDIKGPFKVVKIKEGSEPSYPYSIASDQNKIFVGSALGRAVKVYEAAYEMEVKTLINEVGPDDVVGMGTPVAIAVDELDKVYVVDVTHSRIMVYAQN